MRLTTKMVLAASLAGLGLACHEEPPADGPPLDGWCGMRGQKVWCNVDADCGNSFAGPYCDRHGSCFSAMPDMYYCGFTVNWGDECLPPGSGKVCNEANMCTKPCLKHEDCQGGYCSCDDFVFACEYWRCVDDACPGGFQEVPDYLGCAPLPETLEGDCLGYGGVCPTGYQLVGQSGCVPVPGD